MPQPSAATRDAGSATYRDGSLTSQRSDSDRKLVLGLLSGFDLLHGDQHVQMPLSGQRVLAFLALHERPLQRVYVAGKLWLDATEDRANASLRTALWRVGRVSDRLIRATPTHLALAPEVQVDVR